MTYVSLFSGQGQHMAAMTKLSYSSLPAKLRPCLPTELEWVGKRSTG